MNKRLIAIAVACSMGTRSQAIAAAKASEPELSCCSDEQVDELKPNMNFYQTKMHRRKKGGKVSFR